MCQPPMCKLQRRFRACTRPTDFTICLAPCSYSKNCNKQNYSPSCFNLARLFLAGKGVAQDDAQAMKYSEKACVSGTHNMVCTFLRDPSCNPWAAPAMHRLRPPAYCAAACD